MNPVVALELKAVGVGEERTGVIQPTVRVRILHNCVARNVFEISITCEDVAVISACDVGRHTVGRPDLYVDEIRGSYRGKAVPVPVLKRLFRVLPDISHRAGGERCGGTF